MSVNELTRLIIGAAINVHRALGPGLLESAYRACLAYELERASLKVAREYAIPLVYKGTVLECGYRADFLVNDLVIVECKAKEKLHPIDQVQVLSYLRLLKLPVALLINFHVILLKDGIQRIVNNFADGV